MNDKENEKIIGGNKLYLWYSKKLLNISKFFKRKSEKFSEKGTPTMISNPTSKFINPFTLLINFTVNNSDKYQIIKQGDYKERYKLYNKEKESIKENDDDIDDDNILTNKEMFIIIISDKNSWFLKK